MPIGINTFTFVHGIGMGKDKRGRGVVGTPFRISSREYQLLIFFLL